MSPRRAAVLRDEGGDQSLREHLVATAARLIAERGTAGLTVRVIAREARVADGVLYNHFTDKEELLAEALQAYVRDVVAAAGNPPAPGHGTVEDNLRLHITRALGVLTRILPAFAGLIGQPQALSRFSALQPPGHGDRPLPATLSRYLRAEQNLGRLDPAADVEAATTMIIGACHELVLPLMFRGAAPAQVTVPPGFADAVAKTVLRGIAPPAGPATPAPGPAEAPAQSPAQTQAQTSAQTSAGPGAGSR